MTRRPRVIDSEAEEAPPEADRLEGFAHPRETERLFGQADAERTLAGALASGRLHHAWLLTGAEGIGKATLAYRFACAALASEAERAQIPDGSLQVAREAIVARQVRALSHPGLLVIRRPWQRDSKRLAQVVPIHEVRRIKTFLQLSAGLGAYRVVIVDRAEEMNAAAANAMLKSLEEPPPRTVFLLVSSEPGRLLPTIHSRCRRLALRPLAETDLHAAVAAALTAADHDAPAQGALTLIAGLADGSVRRALALISGGATEQYGKIVALLSALPRLDFEAAHRLADGLAGSAAEPEFQTFFALLQGLIARCLRRSATGEPMLPGEAVVAQRLMPEGSGSARRAAWGEAWEAIARDKADAMALNLDRKALIIDTLHRLQSVSAVPG